MDINDQRDHAEETANRNEVEREGLAELEAELAEIKNLIDVSIGAVEANNSGRRIALYLDRSMTGPNGFGWLPVMNIEHDGCYAPFLPRIHDRVAQWFAGPYEDAKKAVEQINTERGITPQQAMAMVADSMGIAARREDLAAAEDEDY